MKNRSRVLPMLFAVAVSAVEAAEWPQFRGPNRDGVSTETGLVRSWPEGGPAVRWRTPLGEGYSGIAVAGGRLYTLFGRPGAQDELAICLDAATGKEQWRVRIDDKWKDRFGDGPRSTPTVDGERVYVLSGRGKLLALKTADGARVWSRNLEAEFGAEPPTWGVSTSPLVDGDRLIVNVGGTRGSSVVAFDKKTGEEVWRSQSDKAGYSAPIAVTVGGTRQLLVLTGISLVALAPEDGTLQWRWPWKTSYDVNAATPIFIAPDRVFISSGYDHGSAMLRIRTGENPGVEELWQTRQMKNKFSSSVLHNGYFYGFDEKTFRCIDAATGESRWAARGLGHGSLIYADGHLIALGDQGTLVLAEASPEAYREKARMQLFDGKTWTVPTLAGGTLYVRDEKELIALSVSEKGEGP